MNIYVTMCDKVQMNINVTDTVKLVTIHFIVLNHYTKDVKQTLFLTRGVVGNCTDSDTTESTSSGRLQ